MCLSLIHIFYDYKSGLTGWLTKMESSKDFAEALGKINAKAHPQEWSYTSQYVKDMLRNGDRVDRTVGTIKSAAFAWYLGGNIKTAMLNLTQNVIVGVPRLQMDVEGGARAYIDGAQKQIVNQYARRFTGDKGKGLSEEEARLIQDLYGDALITDAYMAVSYTHLRPPDPLMPFLRWHPPRLPRPRFSPEERRGLTSLSGGRLRGGTADKRGTVSYTHLATES